MAFRTDPGYYDLSFTLQALDNTGTFFKVDSQLLRAWTDEGRIKGGSEDEAASYLSEYIIDLQLEGDLIQCGSPRDQISIHKDAYVFAAQFSTDARDDKNRRAAVLCFGRLPRATGQSADRHGVTLLRAFLQSHGVAWTAATQQRYLTVCQELAKVSEPGTRLFGRRLPLPRLRIPPIPGNATEDPHVVRLGRRARQEAAEISAQDKQAARSGTKEESESARRRGGKTVQPVGPAASVTADPADTARPEPSIPGQGPDQEKAPAETGPPPAGAPAFTAPGQEQLAADQVIIPDAAAPQPQPPKAD